MRCGLRFGWGAGAMGSDPAVSRLIDLDARPDVVEPGATLEVGAQRNNHSGRARRLRCRVQSCTQCRNPIRSWDERCLFMGAAMHTGPQAARLDRGAPTLVDRASAILRDEVANGALAKIAAAGQGWTPYRRGLVTPELTRGLEAEILGLRDLVLELVAPSLRSTPAPPSRPVAWPDRAAEPSPPTIEPLPVLRAVRSVPPGGAGEIHTGLRNDGPTPVQMGFLWSDLVAEPDGRIQAGRLRLVPGLVRVPAGGLIDLTIGLDVPTDAQPGLYRTLLEATEPLGVRALLTFPVGFEL